MVWTQTCQKQRFLSLLQMEYRSWFNADSHCADSATYTRQVPVRLPVPATKLSASNKHEDTRSTETYCQYSGITIPMRRPAVTYLDRNLVKRDSCIRHGKIPDLPNPYRRLTQNAVPQSVFQRSQYTECIHVKFQKTNLPTEYVSRYYRGDDKSLARPTSRCILFDGENI
jgi:hypothetical protein